MFSPPQEKVSPSGHQYKSVPTLQREIFHGYEKQFSLADLFRPPVHMSTCLPLQRFSSFRHINSSLNLMRSYFCASPAASLISICQNLRVSETHSHITVWENWYVTNKRRVSTTNRFILVESSLLVIDQSLSPKIQIDVKQLKVQSKTPFLKLTVFIRIKSFTYKPNKKTLL